MKTIIMKKEDHEKWDAALRSGKYEQGQGGLRIDNKYCCLGVLEHVLDGHVEIEKDGKPGSIPSNQWLDSHAIKFSQPTESGMTYRGRNPWLEALGSSAALANDQGRTFVEIADAITEAVEYLE